ncbi:zinc metalloproteinase nas-13 [Drosophila biarmipes]|uniref:zinc metalloproteinase nas-13 n=1 Tax=Drosophila biarmipes TaxID=125945 RepID=UPI001CDACF64|nr:zinc metalloproteinase nas-13 [Drosophila biarmipes]
MGMSRSKPRLLFVPVLLSISLGDSLPAGALVDPNKEEVQPNPEELGPYFEGDMSIPLRYRNGILELSSRWPGGVVPYVIEGSFTDQELRQINNAIQEYHTRTCVRFRLRTSEDDFISIGSENSGCWSAVGRLGGRQELNLQSPNCLRKIGTSIHELMHALGFFHEQNRHERDSYVRLIGDNVVAGKMKNFRKYSSSQESGFGVEYDYGSVMHYSATSFTRNGLPTMEALRDTCDSRKMGQRLGFSAGDVRKINAMYKCQV